MSRLGRRRCFNGRTRQRSISARRQTRLERTRPAAKKLQRVPKLKIAPMIIESEVRQVLAHLLEEHNISYRTGRAVMAIEIDVTGRSYYRPSHYLPDYDIHLHVVETNDPRPLARLRTNIEIAEQLGYAVVFIDRATLSNLRTDPDSIWDLICPKLALISA